jgi:hypothetical protein
LYFVLKFFHIDKIKNRKRKKGTNTLGLQKKKLKEQHCSGKKIYFLFKAGNKRVTRYYKKSATIVSALALDKTIKVHEIKSQIKAAIFQTKFRQKQDMVVNAQKCAWKSW